MIDSALHRLHRAGKQIAGGLLDAVLPLSCHACRAPVVQPGGLCAGCWAELEMVSAPVCDVYGAPLPFDNGAGSVSARAVAHSPHWRKARGAAVFNDASQGLVHALKYHDRHEVAGLMARMMVHAGRELVDEADLIVPVPLHRWRLWSRRYNQSALLASNIAQRTGKPYRADLMQRTRRTRSQVGLSSSARGKNVKGAFSVSGTNGGDVLGKRVLLVDDVLTSGATASECARTLKRAGATHVDLIVFALVSDPA